MLKLYLRGTKETRYWEAWANEREVTIHWGVLGEVGQTHEIQLKHGDSSEGIIRKEAARLRQTGYRPIPRSRMQRLILQYKIDRMGQVTDFEKRVAVENRMNECLGWTGLGHCDGGDMGSGSMNVFCFVVDAEQAAEAAVEELAKSELLDGCVIGHLRGEKVEILWPRNFEGTFAPI